MRTGIFAAMLGLASLPLAARAAAPAERLPLECVPLGTYASDWYEDSRGPAYSWHGDGFPDCESPEFWNGIGGHSGEGPFTFRDSGATTSDGTSVTVRVEIELGFPEDAFATLSVDAAAEANVHAPTSGGPLVPATLVFETERSGGLVDYPIGGLWGRMTGPGVDLWPDLDALSSGVHEFDVLLEPGAIYEVRAQAGGTLDTNGSGTRRVTFYVLAPEPAAPLLLLAGAVAFGLRSVLDAHRMRAQRGGVRRSA